MWDVQTGRELVVYNHMGPVRSVAFAEGGQRFATVSDPFTDSPGLISVFETPDDVPTDQCEGGARRGVGGGVRVGDDIRSGRRDG